MDTWFKIGVLFAGIQAVASIFSVLEFFGVKGQAPSMDARFYIPSAIVGGSAVFTGIALYLSYRAIQASQQGSRSTRELSPSKFTTVAPAVSSVDTSSREFVKQTAEELMAAFKGYTQIQAEILSRPYIGKWLKMSLRIRNIGSGGLVFAKKDETVILHFKKEWIDHLSVLSMDNQITAIGRITNLSASWLELSECELIDA